MKTKYANTVFFQKATEEIIHQYLPDRIEYDKFIKVIKTYHKGAVGHIVSRMLSMERVLYTTRSNNTRKNIECELDSSRTNLLYQLYEYMEYIRKYPEITP